ncbi:MAG: SDR family NAD(P)-dependent oxidoreductase [Leptolyngbyaceae bacterium]|nr:SDR family NAD(P)-dependent oxidoreductase [Leptolyngbyaceae bacterium]
MTDLHQAVVLITGATGGFGQELTRQLLMAGSRLILTDLDQTMLTTWAETAQRDVTTGEILACIPADLAEPSGSEVLYQQVQAMGIPVDILINNAGIALLGRMDEVPVEKWERLMQINLLAPMRLSALFTSDMIARRKGHIVNISSMAGWCGYAGLVSYAASKFGLRGFSEGLWEEVKPYNVQVTAVYPFFSRTPILRSQAYGTLAKNYQGFPDHLATDPAQVMAVTLRGIVQNKLHVFPDRPAQTIHLLKRFFPQSLNWLSAAFTRRFDGVERP